MNNTYIQNKLDEIYDLISREIDILENAISDDNHALQVCSREEIFKLIERYKEQALTDYHNHIVEKISGMEKENIVDSINMSGEITTADMKIGFNQAISKIISLLQDTNQKE